jgi:pimeloyl-ACP methyl ester carboxylesterase
MSKTGKNRFVKFVRKVVKYTILFIVLYAVVRISSGIARQHANERALGRLYEGYRALPQKPPTMFIPGMMASILKDRSTGRIVYGNVLQGLIKELELPIDGKTLRDNQDELVAGEVVRKFSFIRGFLEVDLNDSVRQVADKIAGYKPGQDGFPYAWDWRRDIVEAAQQLDRTIREIKKQKGNPDLKLNLMCHSAGGLVARYYAKYGGKDVLDDPVPVPTYEGAKNINKIIMLGTPNTGSVESFMTVHQGLWLPTIGRATAEMIFTMPALYELMPLEGKKVFIDPSGKPLDIDLYDPANWEKYGWSVFNPELQKKALEKLKKEYGDAEGEKKFREKLTAQRRFVAMVLKRAQKFQAALWAGDPFEEKKNVRYIVFGGDRALTLQSAILGRDDKGIWKTTFKTDSPDLKDALYGYGDMSVTKESVLGRHEGILNGIKVRQQLPLSHSVFFFSNHVDMPKDMTFLDNILHLIFEEYEPSRVPLPQRKKNILGELVDLLP